MIPRASCCDVSTTHDFHIAKRQRGSSFDLRQHAHARSPNAESECEQRELGVAET